MAKKSTESLSSNPRTLSRRLFMARAALVSAAAAAAPSLLLPRQAHADIPDGMMVTDTMAGIIAFVVPGNDAYSAQQDVTHTTPGGVEQNAHLVLEFSLNQAGAAPPPLNTFSELVTQLVDDVVTALNLAPNGPFVAPFANLLFEEKVAVFNVMDSNPALAPLANNLMIYSGLLSYSEAPFLDPATGQLVADPVGWEISSYEGVSDGRKDYRGYFHGHRKARC